MTIESANSCIDLNMVDDSSKLMAVGVTCLLTGWILRSLVSSGRRRSTLPSQESDLNIDALPEVRGDIRY